MTPTKQKTKPLCEYRPDAKGVIEYIQDRYGQVAKLVNETGHWMVFNDVVWEDRDKNGLDDIIMDSLADLHDDAVSKLASLKKAGKVDSNKEELLKKRISAFDPQPAKVKSYRDLTGQGMKVSILQFDIGNFFNFPNGTLDMDTMVFRQHAPGDLLTRSVEWRYDPKATCPKFMEYLHTTIVKPSGGPTGPGLPDGYVTDYEAIDRLIEMLGYSLTTSTIHEIIVWLWGWLGANGKSTLLKILYAVAGAVCAAVNFNNMANGKGEYYMADLKYARVAICHESDATGTSPMDMLKSMGGGSLVSARDPGGRPFKYQSYTTPVWAFNAFPRMTEAGGSVERRLNVFPFYRSFENDPAKNPHLADELIAQELPGIFNLLMSGWQRLKINGKFTDSQTVKEVTLLRLNESCTVRQWLNECTERSDKTMKGSDLYHRYDGWMMTNSKGRQTLSSNAFYDKLRQYNVVETTTGGVANFKLEVTSTRVMLN